MAPPVVQRSSKTRLPPFPINMPRQEPSRVYDSASSSSANEAADTSIVSMFDGVRIDDNFTPREDGGAQTRLRAKNNK